MLSDYRVRPDGLPPHLRTRVGRGVVWGCSIVLLAVFPIFWTLTALWLTADQAKQSFLELLATVLYGVRERDERGQTKGGA